MFGLHNLPASGLVVHLVTKGPYLISVHIAAETKKIHKKGRDFGEI